MTFNSENRLWRCISYLVDENGKSIHCPNNGHADNNCRQYQIFIIYFKFSLFINNIIFTGL